MAADKAVALSQLDAVLEAYNQLRSRSKYEDLSDLGGAEVTRVITLIAAAIDRLAPPGSRYRQQAQEILAKAGALNPYTANLILGVALALRADYDAGRMQAIHELIHADLFADFLEMADHLLEEGYKDPAAVLAGGVLEEHLRKLSDKNNIATAGGARPKKAEALNMELVSKNVYSKLDQKSVTAWLDLRNKAAHARYADYAKEQVALMVQGVRDFLSRHPA
jgi:hypothetical protein